jgi:hypothetical protein
MPRLPFSPRRALLFLLIVLAGLCALAYRTDPRALAAWADGSAADARAHADTLGVAGAIYVPSLPHRGDRRANMRALAGRLGARLTFVDAADARGPAVGNILDHVRVLRQGAPPTPAEFAWPPGGAPPLDWTAPVLGADTLDRRTPLTCSWDNVTIRPFSAELPDWDVLNAGKVACWESHVAVLRRVAAAPWRAGGRIRAADVAIVLEDDVDLELDIAVRLAGLWPHLPKAWDMVFLGACARACTCRPAADTRARLVLVRRVGQRADRRVHAPGDGAAERAAARHRAAVHTRIRGVRPRRAPAARAPRAPAIRVQPRDRPGVRVARPVRPRRRVQRDAAARRPAQGGQERHLDVGAALGGGAV